MNLELFDTDAAIITTVRGTLLAGWGEINTFASPPDNGKPAFYLNDFFLTNPKPWMQFSHYREIEHIPTSKRHYSESIHWELPLQEDFTSAVTDVIQKIRAGVFSKAVPYAKSSTRHPIDTQQRYHMLFNANHHAREYGGYVYCCWRGDEGMIGVSPEQIFTLKDQVLSTVACAGTSSSNQGDDNEKTIQEHGYVVEGIKHSLSGFCQLESATSYWKQAGNSLYHLVTPLKACSNTLPAFEELLRLLHPTAAIGCFPKAQGKAWLQQYNAKTPRHFYGAPIGYRWPEKNEEAAYVAIRNVQWREGILSLFAGCGVVESSDPMSEWNEWQAKFNATKSSVGL